MEISFKNYLDRQLLDLLEFWFPLNFDTNTVLTSTVESHASTKQFSSHVESYIKEEIKHGAIFGPYEHKPINLHVSPFMTRDKPDSDTRRTIVDLSWPKGQSVNAGVQKDKYLGSDFVLNYPSVDDIVKRVIELGPGSLLCKVDISRAFRQFIKSLKINRPLNVKNTSILTDVMIFDILETTAKLEHPQVFTTLYLLALLSFLRLSNKVPHSFTSFDLSRRLARGDIIFCVISPLSWLNGPKPYSLGIKLHVSTFQYFLVPSYALWQH